MAIFHAFTTMTLAYRLSFLCRPLEIGGVNTPGQDIVVNVAGGFFLYDLISWIIYGYVIAKYVIRGREGGREGVARAFFLYDLISWILFYGYVTAKYVGREGGSGRRGGKDNDGASETTARQARHRLQY